MPQALLKLFSKTSRGPLPPLPNTPPENYYEEPVPLSPGTVTEYITSRSSPSPPNSMDDGYYEELDIYRKYFSNQPRKNSDNDSDVLTSSSGENSMESVEDCRICAVLLKKKRFRKWAKQLTVIRGNRLECYKSFWDQSPYMDLPLNLCNVIYIPKNKRKKKHELRFSLPGGKVLVLAVQSKEQAEKWLEVVREVNNLENGLDELVPRKRDKEPEKECAKEWESKN